jgi:hypothetical protein
MRASSLVAAVVGGVLCVGCGERVSPAGPSAVESLRSSDGGQSSSVQAPASLPFRGTLEGTQTVTPLAPPFIFVNGEASGTATHLGKFTVQFPHTVNFALAQGTGTYTFTAANGDTLTADFTGTAQVGTVTSIIEQAVITGGTGRFAGAEGSFTARRIFNPATGVTTGSFEGTIAF